MAIFNFMRKFYAGSKIFSQWKYYFAEINIKGMP